MRKARYYLNVRLVDEDTEIAFWLFTVSGPGPNGPTHQRHALDADAPDLQEMTIQQATSQVLEAVRTTYPSVLWCVRATY